MPPKVTANNLKAEILDAYNELYEEHEQLQKQFDKLAKEKKKLEAEAPALHVPEADVEEPTTASVDDIVAALTHLRTHFSGAVNTLSAQLTSEAEALDALRRQAQVHVEQLQELHDLTVEPGTLDQLLQTYQEQSAARADELARERQAFEQEIEERRTAWKHEQEMHTRAIKERDQARKRARQRDREEYEYQLAQARRRDQDEYDQQEKQRQKELDALKRSREKEWAAREAAIAEQEARFAERKAQVEAIPETLDAAIRQAEEEAAEAVRREARRVADLYAKEVEGEMEVYEQRVQALQNTLAKQTAHLTSLEDRLDTTLKQAQDLAFRAIESRSHATSFEAIRELAMEQVKGKQKTTSSDA